MTDKTDTQEFKIFLEQMGYTDVRQLPTGEWAAIMPMLFTFGIFIGLDRYSWRTRWCYENLSEAKEALTKWDGKGDPPGLWIKQKPEDRLNPEWAKEYA